MRPIFAELPDYIATMQAGPALAPAEALISAPRLRILAIKILGWLKEQGWDGRHPLSGEEHYTWCKNLMTLLSESPEWRQLIEGDGQTFDFHRSLAPEEIVEIIAHVGSRYHPPVHFTPRRPDEL